MKYHLYEWETGWALWKFVEYSYPYIVRQFIVNSAGEYPEPKYGNHVPLEFDIKQEGWREITEKEARKLKLETL